MNVSRTLLLSVVLAGLVSPVAQAAVSPADAAATCKAEAQARYARGDRQARVKFKGMFGGSDVRKVRIQVLPAEGKAFLAWRQRLQLSSGEGAFSRSTNWHRYRSGGQTRRVRWSGAT